MSAARARQVARPVAARAAGPGVVPACVGGHVSGQGVADVQDAGTGRRRGAHSRPGRRLNAAGAASAAAALPARTHTSPSRARARRSYDCGRFIQQSYYGAEDGSDWNGGRAASATLCGRRLSYPRHHRRGAQTTPTSPPRQASRGAGTPSRAAAGRTRPRACSRATNPRPTKSAPRCTRATGARAAAGCTPAGALQPACRPAAYMKLGSVRLHPAILPPRVTLAAAASQFRAPVCIFSARAPPRKPGRASSCVRTW